MLLRTSLIAGLLASTALIAPITPAAGAEEALWNPTSTVNYNTAGNWVNPAGWDPGWSPHSQRYLFGDEPLR